VSGLFKWGVRKAEGAATPPPSASAVVSTDQVTSSKVLRKFLSAVAQQPSPILVDLGPVVGPSISFFGERLECKIHVVDLFTELEKARRANAENVAELLSARLVYGPESADGILLWDLFDYLDKATSQIIAGQLVKMLRKGGALYGFFANGAGEQTTYHRFIVESDEGFRQKAYPATPVKRNVLVNRDINRMFEGLVVAESVLLKSNTREALFRKA
jgi:hypothetical protein